ncbi:MAG: hypothetical protein U1E16_11560 [Hyphomicrobiales bacterium]
MNIHTSPAAQRNGARQADPPKGGMQSAASHEMKFREDAAGYVAAMLAELRQISAKAGFDKLVSSLDAAYYVAYGALDDKARETASEPVAAAPKAPAENNSNSMEQKTA